MYQRTSYPPEFDSDLVPCGLTTKHKDDTDESSDDSDDGSDADSSDDDSDESDSDKKKKKKQKGADADDGTEGELSMKELRDKLLEYVAQKDGQDIRAACKGWGTNEKSLVSGALKGIDREILPPSHSP